MTITSGRRSFFFKMLLHSSPHSQILKAYSWYITVSTFDFFSLSISRVFNGDTELQKHFNLSAYLYGKTILSLKSRRMTNLRNDDEHSCIFAGYQYKYNLASSFTFTEVTFYVFSFFCLVLNSSDSTASLNNPTFYFQDSPLLCFHQLRLHWQKYIYHGTSFWICLLNSSTITAKR